MSFVRFLILAFALPAPAFSQAPAPAAQPAQSEHRLSPEEIQKVLDEAARKRGSVSHQLEASEPAAESRRLPVHGEVGVSIGTGGYRSAYGTAFIGLPGDGAAIISMGTERLRADPYFGRRE